MFGLVTTKDKSILHERKKDHTAYHTKLQPGRRRNSGGGRVEKLKDYNNIVVTLDPLNQFGNDLQYDRYYCLNLRSYYLFPTVIGKLRRIIRENKVDLVHSQLYWSTVLARYACPKDIPLVTSIQASLTDSVEYKKTGSASLIE